MPRPKGDDSQNPASSTYLEDSIKTATGQLIQPRSPDHRRIKKDWRGLKPLAARGKTHPDSEQALREAEARSRGVDILLKVFDVFECRLADPEAILPLRDLIPMGQLGAKVGVADRIEVTLQGIELLEGLVQITAKFVAAGLTDAWLQAVHTYFVTYTKKGLEDAVPVTDDNDEGAGEAVPGALEAGRDAGSEGVRSDEGPLA